MQRKQGSAITRTRKEVSEIWLHPKGASANPGAVAAIPEAVRIQGGSPLSQEHRKYFYLHSTNQQLQASHVNHASLFPACADCTQQEFLYPRKRIPVAVLLSLLVKSNVNTFLDRGLGKWQRETERERERVRLGVSETPSGPLPKRTYTHRI